MSDPLRFRILDGAEAALWHLLWPVAVSGVERWPGIDYIALQPVLADLLREGRVEIFDWLDGAGPPLPLDEALAVVADDANWQDPASHPRDRLYGVVRTVSGDDELGRLYDEQLHTTE